MIISKNICTEKLNRSCIVSSYWDNCKIAALDIETTGLSPNYSQVIVVGVLTFEEDNLYVTQLFAESLLEEEELLSTVFDLLEPYDILLNYNGTSFDLPFLNKRAEAYGLNKKILPCKSIDLYKFFKHSYITEILPDLKLKTVERFVGYERKDKISGLDCVNLYKQYLDSPNNSLLDLILLHNFEDLACFPSLLRLFSKIDIHEAMYHCGFPVALSDNIIYVNKLTFQRNQINASGYFPSSNIDYVYFGENYTFTLNNSGKCFNLELPFQRNGASCIAINPEEIVLMSDKNIYYKEVNNLIRLTLIDFNNHFTNC